MIFRYISKALTTNCHSICKKYQFSTAGVPWLGWGAVLYNKWLGLQFLVKVHNNLVVASVPDWGGNGRQLISVSLQLGTWLAILAHALTGKQIIDLWVCRTMPNPLSNTSQGCSGLFIVCFLMIFKNTL